MAYLYLRPAQLFCGFSLVLLAAMLAIWLRNPRHAVTWASLPFVLAHVVVAHKEARFLFPLAILATAFPVPGFSPRLALWQGSFTRIWRWRTSWAAKTVTAISLLGMGYFALYPFGVRPHMPMAVSLPHWPGAVYSLAPAFRLSIIAAGSSQTEGAVRRTLNKVGLSMSETQNAARDSWTARTSLFRNPAARRLWQREKVIALCGLLPRHHLPAVAIWYTLYRVERSAAIRS